MEIEKIPQATAESVYPELEATEPIIEAEAEEEDLTLSDETIAEIGSPDKELVFLKVAKAYEEAKSKRERYKKIGPAFVFISGAVFLTLMFTLNNKITFLILWVVTALVTAALMIRAEYRYHQFQTYLGLTEEDSEEETVDEEDKENPPSDEEQKEDLQQDQEEEPA